ncbi:YhcN/YlaJ family sporulation lipoprotein [Paenibacillus gorillae]|uniref:YhcN/YlaJ family sporulation lipoprotein n=1 Tax=Paenibacillus gorillae TaxID=1243662 RepID=UPI0004AD16DE|nr:YhcN/YlaJ family sporulation lipoprotein [Paenibacillus gorillae]
MRKPFILLSAASIAITAMLAGCAANQGDLGNRNIRPNSVRYDANGNIIRNTGINGNYTAKRFANDQLNEMNRVDGRRLNSNNIVGSHKNYKMEMSQEIADRITALGTVKSSYVLLTDNNAYVAVSFEDHFNKTSPKALSRTHMGYTSNNPVAETHKKYSAMSTGESALTAKVKQDIADEVKKLHPNVKNVYVSANPDFVTRMNSYTNDVKLGHPIQGFVAEFNAMAERLFPANAARIDTNNQYRNNAYRGMQSKTYHNDNLIYDDNR